MGEVIQFKMKKKASARSGVRTALALLQAACVKLTCTGVQVRDDCCEVDYQLDHAGEELVFPVRVPGPVPVNEDVLTRIAREAAETLVEQLTLGGGVDPDHWNRVCTRTSLELEASVQAHNPDIGDEARARVLYAAIQACHAREIARCLAALAVGERATAS